MYRHKFSAADEWLIRAQYPHVFTRDLALRIGCSKAALHHRAYLLGIRKSELFLRNFCRLPKGTRIGVAHQYPKGHLPANTGTRRPGYAPGRMRETQFKKGQISINAMPMWSFRWVDGYLMLKTGKQHAPPNTGWEYVHKLIWEQHNGPLPDWRVARIWWRDGDHANCSLSNLELVAGAAHVARTTIHTLPESLKKVILLKGALKRRIRRMEEENGEEHDGRSPQPPVRDDRSLAG
jgi:HNH endonuclease